MSATLVRVQQLAEEGKIRISDHGSDALAADDLLVAEVIAGLRVAEPLED
jgi:hypothetical protein